MQYPIGAPVLHYISTLATRERKVQSFLISFYVIGVLGMIIPYTQGVFIKLTPYALVFNSLLLLLFHRGSRNLRAILTFVAIFLAGFIIELVGVNTGKVFGHYIYGNGLGIKLFNTPLLIGINWLLLVYLSANLAARLKTGAILSVIIASAVMTGVDLILEQVASQLDLWYWTSSSVPLQNYVAWFFIAILFHTFVRANNVKTSNPIAFAVLFCQVLFFAVLYVYFKISI
jgi:bisanhydrobacterioruberin hydratase